MKVVLTEKEINEIQHILNEMPIYQLQRVEAIIKIMQNCIINEDEKK